MTSPCTKSHIATPTPRLSAVRMKQFDEFPAVEWVAHFKNTGKEDTPIIEDIRAIDVSWAAHGDVSCTTARGRAAESTTFCIVRTR